MTDEQMKADLAVLANEIAAKHATADMWTYNHPAKAVALTYAAALQRIHDALSARLADVVQPAAGEGGLRATEIRKLIDEGVLDGDGPCDCGECSFTGFIGVWK